MDDLGLNIMRIIVLAIGAWLVWGVIRAMYAIIKGIVTHTFTPSLMRTGMKAFFLYSLFFLILTIVVVVFKVPL